MEDQNKKKKSPVDIISIIFAVGCIYLFGPLPGICGFGVEELMKRVLAKNDPDNQLYKVLAYVLGAVGALALNVVFRMILGAN